MAFSTDRLVSCVNTFVVIGKLLGALLSGLTNNHKTVRKNSATAIGYLCKAAKDSSIDNLLNKLVNIYSKNSRTYD